MTPRNNDIDYNETQKLMGGEFAEWSFWHSKSINTYLNSGRPLEYLQQALSNVMPLSGYEEDTMKAAGIEIEKNRKCFEMFKAILKEPKFDAVLAEAKADELEGRKARKNPTARLIHRLMLAVGSPVLNRFAAVAHNLPLHSTGCITQLNRSDKRKLTTATQTL